MPTIEERADYLRDHHGAYRSALIATLTEFEAFRRDASDEAERILNCTNVNKRYAACLSLNRFIIPKPVEPLVAVMAFNSLDTATAEQRAANLREDAKALGYEIKLVEVGDAD